MNKIQEQVREFHSFYGVPIAESPAIPAEDRAQLREDLIDEEFAELKSAVAAENIVQVADALGDLLYVVFGAAIEFGIDMEPIVNEIHRSNLSKLGLDGKPIYAENGKVLKGPNYFCPKLEPIIAQQKAGQ